MGRGFSSSSKFNLPGSSKVTQSQSNCRVLARFWPRLACSFLEGDASAAKFGIAADFQRELTEIHYTAIIFLELGKRKYLFGFIAAARSSGGRFCFR